MDVPVTLIYKSYKYNVKRIFAPCFKPNYCW